VIAVRVRAVPESGRANKALIGLLSKALKTPKSDIEIIAGMTARIKRLRIRCDGVALASQLETCFKS
jgi:uncharacterized protein YggU (UPF0235/DUF167 family)